jgi:hypothetical protein
MLQELYYYVAKADLNVSYVYCICCNDGSLERFDLAATSDSAMACSLLSALDTSAAPARLACSSASSDVSGLTMDRPPLPQWVRHRVLCAASGGGRWSSLHRCRWRWGGSRVLRPGEGVG